MNAYQKFLINLFCILLGFNVGCSPTLVDQVVAPPNAVDAIQTGTSLWVIRQAYKQCPSCFMLGDPKSYVMFASPVQGGWATVFLDFSKKAPLTNWALCTGGTGTFFGCSTMADIVNAALQYGFRFLKPEDLPAEFPEWVEKSPNWIYNLVWRTPELMPVIIPAGAMGADIVYQFLPSPGKKE